jgi:hypothetical protein
MLQRVWYRAGTCTSSRTCRSTGGLGGKTSIGVGELKCCFLFEGKCTYKDASPAGRALATKTLDLAIGLHLVILKDGHLDLLALMLNLFGGLYTDTGWYIKESPERG